ncbi:hypothetical protein [Micromonospora coxensis]|uniref:Uncharacterized protein n=1 Tax=Micromonospora coxensis TaxID=356852 RepID=A0A1C5GZ95_9ACTN|nr:hypothetical protein [Micromonospora coxensis]SCG39139.1 hypothetical protein GA0070614_0601 [Micromonospora coxensis]
MTSDRQEPAADRGTHRIAIVRPLLLAAAVTLAAVHALGILVGDPLLRYAEILALLPLLAYGLLGALPAPRVALLAASTVLVVDAVRTVPAVPTGSYGWQVSGLEQPDLQASFVTGLSLTWAPLLFVLLLVLPARKGSGLRRHVLAVAALPATLVTGYAAVRLGDMFLGTRDAQRASAGFGYDAIKTLSAAALATLTPLALALAAIGLAAMLARQGRRLAAAGAMLLALAALPHLDDALDAVPTPVYAGDRTALFAWDAITPSLTLPAPVPALTAVLELSAYILLAIGLTHSRAVPR